MTTAAQPAWIPRDWRALDTDSVQLIIGWEGSRNAIVVRRILISQNVQADLQEPIRATTERLAERRPVTYNPDLELDPDQYAVVPRDQLDPDSTMLKGLELSSPEEAVKFDITSRTILFYALVVGPADQRIVFVRRANPSAHLSHRYLTLFSEQLDRLNRPVLSFDTNWVDLVLIAGHGLAVLDLKPYERLFRDSPELIRRTPAKVAELSAILPMSTDTQAVLADAAQRNTRVRARLLATLAQGHLGATPNRTKLRAEMTRHGFNPDDHLLADGSFAFEKKDVLRIMQLLNEDLTIGGLSDTPYIINKKSPATS